MATAVVKLPRVQAEGLRSLEFQLQRQLADVCIAGYSLSIGEAKVAQIEPLLTFSLQQLQRELQALPVDPEKKKGITLPWKKNAPVLYQITGGLMTLALATSAMGSSRIPKGGELAGNSPTPIHHFAPPRYDEGAQTLTPTQTPRIRGSHVSVVQVEKPVSLSLEDLSLWPDPSPRPTTVESARALHNATKKDPNPTLPPLVIDDGLGI